MTAARKLAEAWNEYRECLADPRFWTGTEGDRALCKARIDAAFDECTRLAHQILQEDTDDKE